MEPDLLIMSPRQELTDDLTAMPPDSGEFRRTEFGPSGPILNTKRTLADFYEHLSSALENCYRCKPILGSNPSPSANPKLTNIGDTGASVTREEANVTARELARTVAWRLPIFRHAQERGKAVGNRS